MGQVGWLGVLRSPMKVFSSTRTLTRRPGRPNGSAFAHIGKDRGKGTAGAGFAAFSDFRSMKLQRILDKLR